MATRLAQQGNTADTPSTITATSVDRHDATWTATRESVGETETRASGKAKAQMALASDRNPSISQVARPHPVGNGNQGPGSGAGSLQGGTQSHLLQIPDDARPRRTVESSIYDWETPLDKVAESSSYYYEPQGELLQEQQEPHTTRTEFSIPHAVDETQSNWPVPSGIPGQDDNNGFAVPKRPSGVPAPAAGVKRKSTSDRDDLGLATHSEPKRMLRTMSEGDADSPTEGRPPAYSTRSQGGPAARMRSGTDTSGSRPRPCITEVEATRPGPGISGDSRRTMTDPSIPVVLPARKVFPIQIGDKLFRLSGASISSDGKLSWFLGD